MCRLLAYLGEPVRLGTLVRGQPHSLYVQSYKPREMLSGTVNVDGFGVGWYVPEVDPTPVRYVSTAPLWADTNFASLGQKLSASCALASVRGATDGMPFSAADTAPFAFDRYLFAHNGMIEDFRRAVMRRLRAALRDEYYVAIRGGTDSEHVFALWLEHLRAGAGDGPAALATAARGMLRDVAGWTRAAGVRALLNVVATDGDSVVATRFATEGAAPSLYYHAGYPAEGRGVVVVSEPLYPDAGWREIPPQSVVTLTRDGGVAIAEA